MSMTTDAVIAAAQQAELQEWQIDLLLDALDLLEEFESADRDNYDPEPITYTRGTLRSLRQER